MMFNLNYVTPTQAEDDVLNKLDPLYSKYSELAQYERRFLNAMILREKPLKVLEVGVAAGGSSVIIANALKALGNGAKLYSIDLSKSCYRFPTKPIGFVLDEYPDLKASRKLFTGGIACEFMDEIGDGIDFAFIDTAHVFPGEVLDFLMVYPYLKADAMVVFHDTSLNLSIKSGSYENVVNAMLCSAITGKKYQPFYDNKRPSNITSIKFTIETSKMLWEVFNLLIHTWEYPITESTLSKFINHFARFYPKEAVEFFKRVNVAQNNMFFSCNYERDIGELSNGNLQKAKALVDFANNSKDYNESSWKNPSLLIAEERRMLYLFAKYYFTGEGDIFDGGICLAGCTEALIKGMMANINQSNQSIWAYELGNTCERGYIKETIKNNYKDITIQNGDFHEIVEKNVAHLDGAEKIKLFIGDILEQEYPDKIEIMFLDVCKTPKINFAMQQLYSRMIPCKSLLIHQDYIWQGLPWIRITMGYLAEYFEYVGSTRIDSAVWLLKKEIPQEVLNIDPYGYFSFEESLKLHNYWNSVFNDKQREVILRTFSSSTIKPRALIFGAGTIGKSVLRLAKKEYEVLAFIDNDKNKWDTEFENVPVCSSDKILEMDYNTVIIATHAGQNAVISQLLNMGVKQGSITAKFLQ